MTDYLNTIKKLEAIREEIPDQFTPTNEIDLSVPMSLVNAHQALKGCILKLREYAIEERTEYYAMELIRNNQAGSFRTAMDAGRRRAEKEVNGA